MASPGLFDGLPVDVAAQISSLLRFADLRSLVRVCRAARRSHFREEWLRKVQLTVPPSDLTAQQLVAALDACAISTVTLADASHLQLVSTKLSDTVTALRISGDGYMVSSYEPIVALPFLESFQALRLLDLSGSAILGVGSLAALTQLLELDVSFTVVVDISPLESLTKLQVLNLESTRVKSIKAVRSMPELRVLNLNATDSLRKITPITSLGKLTKLSINDKHLTELDSLVAVAPTLTALDAIDVRFLGVDVAPPLRQDALASLSHLQSLHTWPMSWTQTLDPLHSMTHLKTLDIRFPPFSDLDPLQALTNLENLRLMVSAARDTSPLRVLKKLKKLVLTGCIHDPRSLDFLDHLPLLRDLSLSGEIHTSVVARLVHVEKLELVFSSASWDSIPREDRLPHSMWAALVSVTTLSLRFPVGEPADLSGLASMHQLEVLDLRYATPRELPTSSYFEFLRSLQNLRELRLAGGGIQDLADMCNLSKLEFLDLTSTNVSNIELLATLRNLQQVELAYTRITDVSALTTLEHLSRVVLPVEASCLPLVRADSQQLRVILHEHSNCLWNDEHHRAYEERERETDSVAAPVVVEALDDLVVAFGDYTGDY